VTTWRATRAPRAPPLTRAAARTLRTTPPQIASPAGRAELLTLASADGQADSTLLSSQKVRIPLR
jgi:hypothetical protein